jgi:hypothetical protein
VLRKLTLERGALIITLLDPELGRPLMRPRCLAAAYQRAADAHRRA